MEFKNYFRYPKNIPIYLYIPFFLFLLNWMISRCPYLYPDFYWPRIIPRQHTFDRDIISSLINFIEFIVLTNLWRYFLVLCKNLHYSLIKYLFDHLIVAEIFIGRLIYSPVYISLYLPPFRPLLHSSITLIPYLPKPP